MTTILPPAPTRETLSPFETGPGTPAGRYLRDFWQPVSLSSDLTPGQALPLKIMGEDFTFYRGIDGQPVITAPGCPHRQTRLSLGTVEGNDIRCLFHGWKFNSDGVCLEAPGQGPRLVERTTVKTYPARDHHGLIFGFFGEGAPPALPDVEGFSKKYGRDMMLARVTDTGTYRRLCNYYINVENALDIAHVPFTHRLSTDPTLTEVGFSPNLGVVRDITVERSELGVKVIEIEPDGYPTESMVMLPNAMHLIVGLRDGYLEQVAWRVPIDDEKHLSFQIEARHTDEAGAERYWARKEHLADQVAKYPDTEICAEQIIRGEKSLRDFVDHPLLVNIEDHVAQMGMRFIADAGKENLAPSDKGVLQLRRMYMGRLADYVSGAPNVTHTW